MPVIVRISIFTNFTNDYSEFALYHENLKSRMLM
jgi:hypothetical protein